MRSVSVRFMEVPWCGPHVWRRYCRPKPLVIVQPASATARRHETLRSSWHTIDHR